jgi:hypothetical protein
MVYDHRFQRGCSLAGKRLPCTQETGGSNPLISTKLAIQVFAT